MYGRANHHLTKTGLPKPLILDHRWVTTYANVTKHQPPPGYESANVIRGVERHFSTFPFFHVGPTALRYYDFPPSTPWKPLSWLNYTPLILIAFF